MKGWQSLIALVIVIVVDIIVVDAQVRMTVVELNCENAFDTGHDSLKNDYEFLPQSQHHWTRSRYWKKLNKIGQEILSACDDSTATIPDLIGLCEIENDTVMRDLTERSLLRQGKYQYVMTSSPDLRGIDVALLYSPYSFGLLRSHSLRIEPLPGRRPTRDILYAAGLLSSGDTLHVFVVHAPSRSGGERLTRPYRQRVAEKLSNAIDSIRQLSPEALIIAMGDFNDYASSPALRYLYSQGLINISKDAKGHNGARGTYRYHGRWDSLDQMLVSPSMKKKVVDCRIGDAPFLLENDERYGGVKPYRTFIGPRYIGGYSDHLPLVLTLTL